MAKDEVVESQTYEIMAGYYSPVYVKISSIHPNPTLLGNPPHAFYIVTDPSTRSSYYKKSGLAPALDRVRMCELAVEHTSTWLMVDPWEAGQSEYQRTAIVLDHFDEMLNGHSDDSISPGTRQTSTSASGGGGGGGGDGSGSSSSSHSSGGVILSNGQRRRFKVMLLAGGDLIESFGEPGVWSEPDVSVNSDGNAGWSGTGIGRSQSNSEKADRKSHL